MEGTIQGGWGYVWTVYGLTWASIVGYMISLWWRDRRL
jgi:hypothetical protein